LRRWTAQSAKSSSVNCLDRIRQVLVLGHGRYFKRVATQQNTPIHLDIDWNS
jgi:hypothetical protein